MVNLSKIYNSCMYNYYYVTQYKKSYNLEELSKKFPVNDFGFCSLFGSVACPYREAITSKL